MSLNNILSNNILQVTQEKLNYLQALGIQNFGYRQFKNNGKSIGFCTFNRWEEIERKNSFLDSMSDHYKKELSTLQNAEVQYIIRTGDVDTKSFFLSTMYKWNLWNSLILYKKQESFIEGYYFIANTENHNSIISHFINQRELFNNISDSISLDIRKIICIFKKIIGT